MNKRSKGNRNELLARRILQESGYLVEKKNTSRWQGNDFWGLFDILAIHPTAATRLIQIKSNLSDFYKARKEIVKWKEENNITNISLEVWLKEPRKEWRIYYA